MIFPELLAPVRTLHSPRCYKTLASPRIGVCIHYDASVTDAAGEGWFSHKDCNVSYNRYYLDSGEVVSIADDDWAAWHMGPCLTKNANSVYYGLSAATNGYNKVTEKQLASMIEDTVRIFRRHGWSSTDVSWRIVGHNEQAIFTKAHTPNEARWGKLGRRDDPMGYPPAAPVIDIAAFRRTVADRLRGVHTPSAEPSADAPSSDSPLLKRGMRHAKVTHLQQLLDVRPASGFFGSLTEEAVMAFQRRNGLEADGVVGDATWAKLRTLDICMRERVA